MSMKTIKKTVKGASQNNLCLVLLFAIIVGGFMVFTYQAPAFSVIRDDFWDIDNTTPPTTTTPVTTTTPPDDGIPDGTWFYLKVMFTWRDWVDPADYSNIIIGVTDAGYSGLAEHQFDASQENTWYTFSEFIVELSGDVYIYMSAVGYATENDYNAATAGYIGGFWNFIDSGAPPPLLTAGYIYYEWVEA